MNTHVVLKPVPGPNGQRLAPGTEVDASEWRNAPLLVEQRYLKPLDAVAEPDGQTQPEASFHDRVLDVVMQDIRDNGPLAQLLRSNELAELPIKPSRQHNRQSRN